MRQNAAGRQNFTCPVCGAIKHRTRRWQAFCSPACRKAAWLIGHRTGTYTDIRAQLDRIEKDLGTIKQALKDNAIGERP